MRVLPKTEFFLELGIEQGTSDPRSSRLSTKPPLSPTNSGDSSHTCLQVVFGAFLGRPCPQGYDPYVTRITLGLVYAKSDRL